MRSQEREQLWKCSFRQHGSVDHSGLQRVHAVAEIDVAVVLCSFHDPSPMVRPRHAMSRNPLDCHPIGGS